MKNTSFLFLLTFVLVPAMAWAQANQTPVITGQVALSTQESTPIEILLTHLQVEDPDNVYPDNFTLSVSAGTNYSVNQNTVTPSPGFVGTLTVPVTVNDGNATSEPFDLSITVTAAPENVPPVITGQTPVTITQGQSFTVTLSHLTVDDPDNTYPADFTLSVASGPNYTVAGTTITPSPSFTGTLAVSVTVNDGTDNSNAFAMNITVEAAANTRPIITGQRTLTVVEGTSITLEFTDLTVQDPDNTYPNGFSMTLSSGANYTFSGRTITPASGFSGTLTVPVTVNDGIDDSDPFPVYITVEPAPVENVKPVITGQTTLSTEEGTPITLQFTNLVVQDSDDTYPNGFTMTLRTGQNYSFSGHTITPATGFTGALTVPVTVNDGTDESDPFNVSISVTPKTPENVAPVITAQTTLSTEEGAAITIEFANLTVTDPDDTYPAGFTMTLQAGNNYTFVNRTVTPSPGFSGTLTVPVTVNDGEDSSAPYNLTITVTKKSPVNTKPVITGQVPLQTEENKPITIALTHLTVSDPDNIYPGDFTLTLHPGANYVISGNSVNPQARFTGTLKVPVTVNDGTVNSDPFELSIAVTAKKPQNVKPTITGQVALSMENNESLTILLSYLTVTDPDNTYPKDFTLKVFEGDNYTVQGSAIEPNPGFAGTLNVKVTVNDGKADSDPFNLKISVTAPAQNIRPVITGQQELTTFINTDITLRLTHLIVNDADNDYPDDFSLIVFEGPNYTHTGSVIKPASGFTGTLSVPVRVNDGIAESDLFTVLISVIERNELRITGQDEIIIDEETTHELKLEHLEVNDPSGVFPAGFTLKIGAGDHFTSQGNIITPAQNFTGTLQVPVTVSDASATSNSFKIIILVLPVNDAPSVTASQGKPIAFSLGGGPVNIGETLVVQDVDNERLVFAEVAIDPERFITGDEVLIASSTEKIRTIFDPNSGTLVLLGAATVAEYQEVLRTVQYEFTNDTLPDTMVKDILFRVNDSELFSDWYPISVEIIDIIQLDVPNVFTPNDDRKNDKWVITKQRLADHATAAVRIFDQRGVLVYESYSLDQAWDGKRNGQTLPAGTYYYSIEINAAANNISKKGTITILR